MNNQRKARSSSNSGLNVVMGIIIAAVLALAVFATYGKVSDKLEENAIANGTKEQTVGYAAKQAGQTVDEYLEQYGLSGSKDVSEKTPLSEMYGFMTLEKYFEMLGTEKTVDEFITEAKLDGQVTKDSMWKDVEDIVPAGVYFELFYGSADMLDQMKSMYGIGDEVTADTPWGEANKIFEEKAEELANATPAPTDEAVEATGAPTDESTADTEAAADTETAADTEAAADTENAE